jgi:3-hydroxyacyl-[acyl-carrier-protein] dehydratase
VAKRRPTSVTLDIHQILGVLPQRFPFVMLDRVTEAVSGKYARGIKCVGCNEPYLQGHFPLRPLVPNVLVVEALAQLGGILAYVSEPFDPSASLVLLLGIDGARFRRPVVPGDRMDLYVEVADHRSNVWRFTGEVTVDGAVSTEAELLASVVDRQP